MATRYVLFTDVTDAELDNTPIQDGQVVFSYPSGRLFLDEGNSRFTMGGRKADDMLSRVSENPVQNKVITNNIINTLTEAKAITKNDVFASTKVIKELAANSANIEDMTQEEYNQLSTEQKYDGTIRNITDVEVEYQYAGGVDYSNETSGLDAINVQDAIDEINNNLAQCLLMEKYKGTNCTLFRVGNLVFLNINKVPNVKTLAQHSIIATLPQQIPFELHWFQGSNTPLSWVTVNNNQSGTITGYIQNQDIKIRNAITTTDNIAMMNGLMVGYVGAII